MVMRTDISTSGPVGPSNGDTAMAKKGSKAAPIPHHAQMAQTMQAGMRHLSQTGMQTVSVDFAELQNQGPAAAAPRPYASKPAGS